MHRKVKYPWLVDFCLGMSQYGGFKQSYLSSGRCYDRIDYTAVLTIT